MTNDSTFHNPVHPHQFGPLPDWDNIPPLLTERCLCWCAWKAKPREGKPGKFDKIPYGAYNVPISTAKPQQWLTFENAKALYLQYPGEFNGVGCLVTPDSGLVFGDIDVGRSWVEDWPQTYVERSPSGLGLRAIWDCEEGISRDTTKPVELYGGNAARFVTITGAMSNVPEYQAVTRVNGELQAWVDRVAPAPVTTGSVVAGPRPDPAWSGQGQMPRIRDVGEVGQRSEKLYGIIAGFLKHHRTPEQAYQILVGSQASWEYYLGKRRGDALKACELAWSDVCKVAAEVPVVELPAVTMQAAGGPPEVLTEPAGVYVWGIKRPEAFGDALLADPAIRAIELTQHQDLDYVWNPGSGCYQCQERSWLKKLVNRFITACWNDDGDATLWGSPTGGLVNDVVAHVRARCHQIAVGHIPAWRAEVDLATVVPPKNMIRFRNGYLDITTHHLYPPDPRLFALNALPHDFTEPAPEPARWLQFLAEAWPDRPESRLLLQEIMGAVVAGDADYQKLFVMIGPPRSGKGTVGKVLKELLGEWAVAGMPLSAVGRLGGIQNLIGKRLWLMSDTRVGRSTDQQLAVETLLTITGQDPMSIGRKHIEDWNGILECLVMIQANSMPHLYDVEGALMARLVPLQFTESFIGREDFALGEKLRGELSGILLWALAGYERLRAQGGRFTVTEAEAEMREEFLELSNPLAGFVGDIVEPREDGWLPTKKLFEVWQKYARDHGIDILKTQRAFTTELKKAMPGIKRCRQGGRSGQIYGYSGVGICGLRDEAYGLRDAEILHGVDVNDEK